MTNKKRELAPKYNPNEVEAGRYKCWVDGKYLEATGDEDKEQFSIVIPPPKGAARLQLDNAWDTTMQYTIAPMKRMQGYDVLWLPGMDNEGIATQSVVESKLREEVKTRYDLGREQVIETAWDWKEDYAKQR